MKVGEIMTREPICLSHDATVQDLHDLIYGTGVHHVPVTKSGKLVAIVSDRDLRSFSVPRAVKISSPEIDRQQEQASVMEIAHGEVISVPPDTDVSQVIEIMLSEGIGAVPVVESVSEKLLGVVSYEDILRVAVGFM